MNSMNIENERARKRHLYKLLVLVTGLIFLTKISGVITTASRENLWWMGLLLLGAMITGFVFQPMTKELFPKDNDLRIVREPSLKLKDHETLMGYYLLVAAIVGVGGYLLSPLLYGRQILFEVSSGHFWWATIASGILNVFIFYFLTKGLRYGDVSLVSTTWGLVPILSLPISFLVFYLVGKEAGISSPSVSLLGFFGIIISVAALTVNALIAKKKAPEGAPASDWFAHHPMLSGILGTMIAGFAVNFDKVAVDAGNPVLHGITVPLIVFLITLGWTICENGWKRVRFVFSRHKKIFLLVGLVYASIVLIMNITLYGHNVNYYVAIKRTAVIFGTLYGIYVLHEGATPGEKIVRTLTAVSVLVGLFLIAFKG